MNVYYDRFNKHIWYLMSPRMYKIAFYSVWYYISNRTPPRHLQSVSSMAAQWRVGCAGYDVGRGGGGNVEEHKTLMKDDK